MSKQRHYTPQLIWLLSCNPDAKKPNAKNILISNLDVIRHLGFEQK